MDQRPLRWFSPRRHRRAAAAAAAAAAAVAVTAVVAAVTVAPLPLPSLVEAHATADALRQAGSPVGRTRRQKGASPQCCEGGSKGQGKGFGEQDCSGFLELGRQSRRRCSRARQCGARAGRVGSAPFLAGYRHLGASTATATAATAAAGCGRPRGGTAAGRHGA